MNGDALPPGGEQVRHHLAPLGEVNLHVVEAGPADGALVILLHGFPEAWFSWQHQLRALATAGYRVLAPDIRGYNLSSKPQGVDAYRIEHLVGDVAGLIAWAGAETATVIGHDWGALVAWHFAMRRPEMLERLAILNVPHPVAMAKALRKPAQMLRSSYALFFQMPWVPERVFLAGNAAVLRRVFAHDPVRKGAFSAEDIERYAVAAKRPGALTGGMNYYRAAFRHAGEQIKPAVISAPVLVIWGEQDRFLGKDLADPPRRLVPNARVVRLPDASHWVQNDRPERVNQLLLDFLKAS